jgi:putative flippase GtrA
VNKVPSLDFALIARFGIAGLLSTLVHLVVVWLASRALQWPLGQSNALAYAVANLASWLMQSRWTFRDQPRSRRRWIVASAMLLALSAICGRLADILFPDAPYAWLVAVLPIIGVSFFVMRHWVFSRVAN